MSTCGIKTPEEVKQKVKEWSEYRAKAWSKNTHPEAFQLATDIIKQIKINTPQSLAIAETLRTELAEVVDGQKDKLGRTYDSQLGNRYSGAEEAYKNNQVNSGKNIKIPGFEVGKKINVYFRNSSKPVVHTIKNTTTDGNYVQLQTDGVTAKFNKGQDRSVEFGKKNWITVKGFGNAVNTIKGSDENAQIGDKNTDEKIAEGEVDLGDTLTHYYMSYLEKDKEEGKDIQTQEFADLQNTILNTYQNTMKNLDTGNVKMEMFESAVDQTAGQIDLNNKKIKIRINPLSRLSRISEVYLHEVNHLMSSHVFAYKPGLKKLMRELRNEAINNGVDYKIFLKGVENPTAEEVQIAKIKYDYIFDKTADPEEFYAYATTNEQVYNAIKDLKVKTPLIKQLKIEKGEKAPFSKVLNKLIGVINNTWRLLSGRGVRGGQMIADMIATIAKVDAEMSQEKTADSMEDETLSGYAKTKINQLDAKLEPIKEKVEEWSNKLNSKTDKFNIVKHLKKIPILNDLMETGISQYLWRMVTEDTTAPDVADMYMVFRHAKNEIERHTSKIQNGVLKVAEEYYKDVDDNTKNAVRKLIMEGDLAQFSAKELKDYLQNDEKVANEIKQLEKELIIDDKVVTAKTKQEQIDGLAEYLISGKTIVHNQQFNANNIATNLMNGNKKLTQNADSETIDKIDRLVSLKVLQKSDPVLKDRLQKFAETENGIDILDKTINMYRGYIDNMREDATLGKYDPIPKGYARAEKGLLNYELIPEEEVKAQQSVLMKLVESKPYTTIEGKNYYLMTGRTKSVGFNEGAIGLISHTVEGIPISQLIRKNNEMLGKKAIGEGELKAKTRKIINAINEQDKDVQKQFKLDAGQALIPVYDHNNEIVDYRIQLTKIEKDMYLPDRKTRLEDMMSHTFSRSIKTSLTASENKKVIDQIIINSQDALENPDDYVLVEEYTEEDRRNGVKYEKRHDRWKAIPDHTKDYIYQKTHHKGILINKKFVELMTGEKDVTIGNFAKFGIDIKKYPVARARLMALESYIKEILGYLKNETVILNAHVLIGNQTSNAVVAYMHGINPIDYTKKFKQKWDELDEYNNNSQLLAELEVKQMAGENVNRKITQVKKQLKDNKWDELVQDGQYTALVEDINIDGQGEGQLMTQAKDWLRKKNLLKTAENVKGALYINKTSQVYNFLLKTVHYGDAITRQIIKEEMEKQEIAKNGKLSKEFERKTLNYLDQLLVNYGYTMNRWWRYAERVGGLFFMKYYLAQMKALKSMASKNMTRFGLIEGAQQLSGFDIQDPLDTYMRTGFAGIQYRWMLGEAPSELATPNVFNLIPDLSDIFRVN